LRPGVTISIAARRSDGATPAPCAGLVIATLITVATVAAAAAMLIGRLAIISHLPAVPVKIPKYRTDKRKQMEDFPSGRDTPDEQQILNQGGIHHPEYLHFHQIRPF
jgi:hypothetical protein